MSTKTMTVENLDNARYALATEGDSPSYEARTHNGDALLVAHKFDSSRPSTVDWYDVQWAREQTSDWGGDS